MGNIFRKKAGSKTNAPTAFRKKSSVQPCDIWLEDSLIEMNQHDFARYVSEVTVEKFLVANPSFLDDFVQKELTLDKVEEWEASMKETSKNIRSDITPYMFLPADEAKRLFQLNQLRSHYCFPLQADPSDAAYLLKTFEAVEEKLPYDIENHLFPFLDIAEENINAVVLYLFEDLLGRHAFARQNLANFLADVQVNYQGLDYHNYHHALCHTQTMYWILKTHPIGFSTLEKKVLMIASLCHDAGHPGFNEEFILALFKTTWYDSPVLERHHSQICFDILMVKETNILHDLTNEEFTEAISDIQENILATFMGRYKDQIAHASELIRKGFSFSDKECRNAAKKLLMMVCDLSASWKPWKVHVSATWGLYEEFVKQGEKQVMLGFENAPLTKNKMKDIPSFQVGFLENLVLPLLKVAAKIFPCLYDAIVSTNENIRQWRIDTA